MPERRAAARTGGFGRRLLWFAGLWLAGLATMALVSYALRALIP